MAYFENRFRKTKIRYMNKATKWGLNAAVVGGLGNALLNIFRQVNEIEKNPGQPFSWKRVGIAGVKGAVVIGGIGICAGAVKDHYNSLEQPKDTDSLLNFLCLDLKMNSTDGHFLQMQQKADLLIRLLNIQFSDKLAAEPIKIGSTVKGTALKAKSDIDVGLTFRKGSFATTADMYYAVLNFLESLIGQYRITGIRDQKKSLGVIFENSSDEFIIDIVPHRLTHKGNNKSGYLYVNKSNSLVENSTFTKTNLEKLASVSYRETQKKIIVLLKHWKDKEDLPISSFLMETLVIDAYSYNRNHIPRNFTDKVIMVFKHISENLEATRITSPENTNNILTNGIDEHDKTVVATACRKVCEEYAYQPNSILKILGK